MNNSILLFFALGALMLVGAGCAAFFSDITSEKAHTLVAKGAVLVDVRTPDEYAAAHIDGAVNIPLHQVGDRVDELGDRKRPVIVYCRSGARSNRAKSVLKAAGFAEVYNLGPMSRW